LAGSLHALIKRQAKTPCAILLAAHIRLLLALADLPSPPALPSRILRIARRYTSSFTPTPTTSPSGAKDLWLARLRAESIHGTADSAAEAWTSARRALPTCAEIWLWDAESSWEEFETLLAESMRDAALREVHQSLLLRVAESMGSDGGLAGTVAERRARVEYIARRCLPNARVWARTFAVLTSPKTEAEEAEEEEEEQEEEEEEEEEALLREVYEYWRGTGDVEEATLAWARWLLLAKRRGEEAMRVISRARHGPGGDALARRWAVIVRQQEAQAEDRDNDTGSAVSAAAGEEADEAGDSGSQGWGA
jgi:hypothetical protein